MKQMENDKIDPMAFDEFYKRISQSNIDLLRQNFPKYWSSIQKYYGITAPPCKGLCELYPCDLQRKWALQSHKDEELSSAIMNVAPSVVSVSVFGGVKRYRDLSGFIIAWDDSNGEATILTSAKIMRFPDNDYYIAVRLANGKILLAEEDYVDYYNNIVTFKVKSDATLVPLNRCLSPTKTAGHVVALGRKFYTCKLEESTGYICMDYPYFGCEFLVSSTCSGGEILEGGPLINKKGHVCGINFYDGSHNVHPLPTSVIDACLNKWDCCGIVMQPWFGLTVIDIAQLPHDASETICGVYGYSSVVVKEVYKGSPADKVGVQPGEKITAIRKSQNKITIDSTSEYARTLTSISGELSTHFCKSKKTPDIDIVLCVNGYDSNICKLVHAENLRVDDKRFCCSWVGHLSDEPEWDMEPQFGSQMEMARDFYNAHENGINTNVILESTGPGTSSAYDTEVGDDVSLYSA